ncbi:MAG: heavy metal translocating P-type ATPase [Halobacteriota archaeon]
MTCTLCDLPTPDRPVTADDVDGEFCCRGCLEVTRTLGDIDDEIPEEPGTDAQVPSDGDCEEAFLTVSGMHCGSCETFIESRATTHEGVRAARASYSAGMVKLTYDPEAVDESALPSLIDGLGYEAREYDAPDEDDEPTGRLLVGGFFGMMTMLWYLLFLYPAYAGVNPDVLLLDVSGSAGAYLLWNVWLMATLVLAYTGFPLFRGAYVSLRARHANMDLLVTLATSTAYVYSTAVLLLGGTEVYFDVAVIIVLAVTVGNYYEFRVRERATNQLTNLTEERVDEAHLRVDDGVETVGVETLTPGDEVLVRTGDRVPVDGTVVEGTASLDESLVTGESLPVRKGPGDDVIGGALVADGAVVVAVGQDATSTLERIVRHLWDVQSARPGAQRLADRLSAVFVPVVLTLAVATTGWHVAFESRLTGAVLTGLAVLVVSCPCALGLATPLGITAGIRAALQEGVVITDASAFERAPDAGVVAFDKTGTLTTGSMELVEWSSEEALRKAAAVEQFSDHPVADAVTAEATPSESTVTGFEAHPGRGVSARVDGETVVVGRPALFDDRGWTTPDDLQTSFERSRAEGYVPSLVGWGGRVRGIVVAGDRPRPEWEAVVSDLAVERRVVVITGDHERAAARFREHPAVDEVFTDVPPEAKTEVVERLRREDIVAMVGDGSNDAPALAAADIGIALERTALSADAADAVLTSGDLSPIPRVFETTAATKRRIRQNLAWAFCYNAVAVPLAVAGLINPLFAAVAMAASSLLVVGNSMRSM